MFFSRRIVAVSLAAAALAASASIAGAQARIELTPFGGYFIASDLYATGGTRVELDNGATLGARFSIGSVEFGYTHAGSDATLLTVLSGQPRAEIGSVVFRSYDINFIGYGSGGGGRVAPFGLLGFGWSVASPEINAEFVTGRQPEASTLFNINFGIGARIAMNERVGLKLEGRWRVTDTNLTTSSGIWCDPYGYCYQYASDWYNSGELTAGLSFVLR